LAKIRVEQLDEKVLTEDEARLGNRPVSRLRVLNIQKAADLVPTLTSGNSYLLEDVTALHSGFGIIGSGMYASLTNNDIVTYGEYEQDFATYTGFHIIYSANEDGLGGELYNADDDKNYALKTEGWVSTDNEQAQSEKPFAIAMAVAL